MVANAIGTFASVTVHCAQCHNHKFDPVPQEDYYRLQAVFAALDRVTPDVTLLVILRDIPEMAGVTANVSALLGRAGYQSDMSRLPSGGQRMRIRSRNRPREVAGMAPAVDIGSSDQSFEAPPPVDPFGDG